MYLIIEQNSKLKDARNVVKQSNKLDDRCNLRHHKHSLRLKTRDE